MKRTANKNLRSGHQFEFDVRPGVHVCRRGHQTDADPAVLFCVGHMMRHCEGNLEGRETKKGRGKDEQRKEKSVEKKE